MTDVIKMPKIFFDNFATLVAEDDRMEFLPELMGNVKHGLMYESFMFQTAERMSDDYNSGYWDFAKIKKNDTGLMMLSPDESFKVSNPANYTEFVVDGRIFGLICCQMVGSHGSFQFHESDPKLAEKLAEMYHNVRDAFYATVDALAYPDEDTDYTLDVKATDEEIEQIKEMSKAVWSLLD